jgi:hypothetical protein
VRNTPGSLVTLLMRYGLSTEYLRELQNRTVATGGNGSTSSSPIIRFGTVANRPKRVDNLTKMTAVKLPLTAVCD